MRPKLLIFSLILVVFGIATLHANRSERAANVADELVEAASVLPENEGKLVIVSGTPQLMDGGILVDEEAGLQVENAIHYSRIPYQKVYAKKSRKVVVDEGEDKFSEDDDITRTEYYVAKEWIVANSKRDATVTVDFETYENPRPVKLEPYFVNADMRVAGFRVSHTDVYDQIETKNCWFSQKELAQACGDYIARSKIDLKPTTDENGHGLLSSGNKIGNVQVLFGYETLESAQTVTIVGRQRGDELVFDEDDPISTAEHVQTGQISREEFLDALVAEDATSRKIGIGGLAVGLLLTLVSLGVTDGLYGRLRESRQR